MAVISKALFESEHRAASVGEILPLDRYSTNNKALTPLAEAGARLFLFTVRPPDEKLWLVAILSGLAHDGKSWVGAPNTAPVTDITGLKRKIRFASGVGIKAKPGTLGMSLQTPRALSDDDSALLQQAAGMPAPNHAPTPVKSVKLAQAAKPSRAARPEPAAKPIRAAKAGDNDLSRATALVADGELDVAFAILHALWMMRSLPRLADALDALEVVRGRPWGLLFPDKQAFANRVKRIKTLAKQPRDPRFASALFELVRDMPLTSNSSRSFWTSVFAILAELDDPRAMANIARARAGWKIRPLQQQWLEVQADRLLARYRERYPDGAPEPTAAEAKLLTALERAIAKALPPEHDTKRRDALLAAVYAAPDDDAPRAVYADFLGDAGDLHGELITLQLLPAPTPVQTKRIKQLLAGHERTWIGPLEPVIAQAGVEFRRGFLSGCRVKLKNAMAAEKYGRDPSWATVEHLRFTGSRFSYQPFSSQDSGVFFVDPVMKSLRDVNIHDDADLAMLLASKTIWKIERLAASTEVSLGKQGLALLAKTDKLPALQALEMLAPPRAWLASTTFGKRLRELVIGLGYNTDARGPLMWLPELARLPALERATLIGSRAHDTYPRWTFTRAADEQLSIATMIATPESFDVAVAALAALPATQLTELAIELAPARRRGTVISRDQRSAMTAAIGRQTRLVAPVAF